MGSICKHKEAKKPMTKKGPITIKEFVETFALPVGLWYILILLAIFI